ncbi:outer membrane lipoprotein-sorting protein [Paenibacillus pinistramenti]|uniref:outer membrane lipoprotein-sorting protein n=1 Tax=Paenibacillus pinistramenti TaxID=1768003 RepID=UPI00110878CC|nr:outer membrane lipoprotein-sorting protein [Paenibacillus pinistramenti]
MRRITWVLAIVMCFSIVLAGCGKKDEAGIVKDLNEVVGKLDSYEGSGVMTLHTGETPQMYKVQVWYMNPSYYRIALTNAQKDITQIVLRNDQGVYVLTPSLNKSFRFQSDWPDNQGQVYLYQTLVRSILSDNTRQFVDDKDSYVFEVAANYNTQSLVRQKIWLSKDGYKPQQVQVSDSSAQVVVEVKFDQFEFGKKFDKKDFDMQENLNTAAGSQGTMLEVDENGQLVEKTADTQTADSGNAASVPALNEDFGIILPTYSPDGVEEKATQPVGSDRSSVMVQYDGEYQYTILESRSLDRAVSLQKGDMIDMGFTFGQLSGDDLQTLTWTQDGLDFQITSADLPVNEMVKIAASMQDQTGK